MRRLPLLILALLVALPVLSVAQSPLVLPAATYVSTPGNSNNYYPFGHTNMRYQQIYDKAVTGGPTLFRFMQLRADQSFGQGDGGFTTDLEISLGVSPNSPAAHSKTWAANNPKPITVVPRQWVFMPKLKTTAVTDWFITIPFEKPFPWAGNAHLVVEVKVYGNSTNRTGNLALDAATGSNIQACRLWNSGSLTSTTATSSQMNQGLVMRLGITPAPMPMFTFFGKACPGSNQQPLHYTAIDAPHLNSRFTVGVAGAVASSPMALVVGNRSNRWGPFPLPFDLTPVGAPGCSLYASAVLFLSLTASGSGETSTQLTIPNDQALKGVSLYTQWYALDAKANNLGLITSRGGDVRIDT